MKDVAEVAATLDAGAGTCDERRGRFETLADRFRSAGTPMHLRMAQVMASFVAGLFVGEGVLAGLADNLDLERWFRLPKRHERKIHGRRHAGIRIVVEGPTLVHALDAHVDHPAPFTAEELLPYRAVPEPPSQTEALHRRKTMRKARSRKKRPILLADLERRYRESTTC